MAQITQQLKKNHKFYLDYLVISFVKFLAMSIFFPLPKQRCKMIAKKGHVTFGGIGQYEFYMPTTGNGCHNRRDRKNCQFYIKETTWCTKLFQPCVGPTLCRKYSQQRDITQPISTGKYIGLQVFSKQRGIGKIVSITGDVCTVQFANEDVQFKFPDILRYKLKNAAKE